MQELHLYEYAVIRVVPRVEREEFINVGVILFCKKQRYLRIRCELNEERLQTLFPGLDIAEVASYLRAIEKVCAGGRQGGTIGTLDVPSRFRWLTATRSTVVQCSKVHPGRCTDLDEKLDRLFKELVM